MDKVTKYILVNFFQTFLSLFFTLFFLASIVFFIKISKLTQLFSVSFLDLGESYLYLLPEIIIYTMPMTFFISVTMSIYKLSRDNESIVLFALSWSPLKLAKIFLWVSLLASMFLLANSILFMPLSKQLNKNFIEYKKMEAKINIQDSEFGQKFQEWNVFISSSGEKSYKDIVLYKYSSEKVVMKHLFLQKR
jgi:lipopolysaccharide export system permease protein